MAAKRELMSPKGDKRYVRRDAKGRIKEVDDVSRSLSQDRRRRSKKTSAKGQGDRGDRVGAAARKSTRPARKTTRSPARKSTRARKGKSTRARKGKSTRARVAFPSRLPPIVA